MLDIEPLVVAAGREALRRTQGGLRFVGKPFDIQDSAELSTIATRARRHPISRPGSVQLTCKQDLDT